MSFNAKNLSYEKQEPAFLRRLKGEFGEGSSGSRERPNPRPARTKSTDADDEPTYVVEGSNEVLSKGQYEELLKGESKENDDVRGVNTEPTRRSPAHEKTADAQELETERRPQQIVAEIGGSKKRKQAKVVSNDKSDDKEANLQNTKKTLKKKSKQKKVKLSFDED